MHEREWTKAELDIVWPLLDGWVWARDMFDEDEGRVWTAELVGSIDTVWVSEGIVGFAGDGPPVEVLLAVVSVALGLDSREAIATAIGERAKASRERSEDLSRGVKRFADLGAAIEAHDCAEMVRRGTATP